MLHLLMNGLTIVVLAVGIATSMAFLTSSAIVIWGHWRGALSFFMKTLFLCLLTAPLAIFVLVWLVIWPFIFFARKMPSRTVTDHCSSAINVAADDVVVHLVHGTFESDARWTRSDSPISQRIRARNPSVKLSRFHWSGANTARGRARAAADLAEQIRESGSSHHYIVAHSHGGNIVRELSQKFPGLAHKIEGVCLLSTPFIHRKEIVRTGRAFIYSHIFGLIVAAQIPLYLAFSPFNLYGVSIFIVSSLVMTLIEVYVARHVQPKMTDELATEKTAVAVRDVQILHAIGDEADTALRFTSLLHEACFRLFSDLESASRATLNKRHVPYAWGSLILCAAAIGAWAVSSPSWLPIAIVLASLGHVLAFLKERIKPSHSELDVLVMASLPVGALSYVLCATKAIAYGDWRLLFVPGIFVFSSETPEGDHSLLKYGPRTDGELIHSTHSHPDAIADVAEWIASREFDKQRGSGPEFCPS